MAYISTCSICGISTCNDTICHECRMAISEIAVYDVEEVRNKVALNRELKRQEEIKKMTDVCPTCGRLSDAMRF